MGSGTWKHELVKQLLLSHEAEVIGGIPLSANPQEDKQIWALTTTSLFSVRSAYWIAMEGMSNGGSTTVSNDGSQRKCWKYLWSINLPHKVRHFAWRACRDILPTKENLKRRKVLVDSCCEACHLEAESSGHLFWHCSSAKEVWRATKLFSGLMNSPFSSFMDLMWYVIMVAKWGNEEVEKILMIAWVMWMNRNKARHGGEKKSSEALFDFALEYLREYQLCCELPAVAQTKEYPKWHPPPMKHGKKIVASLGAVETEAKAFEFGLQFARDMLIHDFVLEGDSLVVVNALKETSPPPALVAVLSNVRSLAHGFRNVKFSHIGRQGNRPAHLLAKHAYGIADFSVWIEEDHCFLEEALLHNVFVAFS
ncbi:uncharacterized protein LOC142620796 [Castanea sativa]|uniref:uncharacterized protein LOC142620796 n=1 Tax=Castanea sativa TaxID=21020 RepID=UPI003F653DED